MIEGQEDVTWEDWVAHARACEEHGVESLFRSDHYLSVEGRGERGSLEAWATFRHPSELAKVVATADRISGGRVELGMGTGWLEAEHAAYGFPFPPLGERTQVLEEQLQVVTGQWADGPFSFEGRHYAIKELDALPKPVQRPRPPLIVGGRGGPRSLALAARQADESRGLRPLTAGCAGVSPGYKNRRRVQGDAAGARRGLPP
jgi:alkanesulfonate monooxygenase SsuD/methylene tetrahydromethanopterin reductase-like flavin-dependent oxidoreductase (luciferase family)